MSTQNNIIPIRTVSAADKLAAPFGRVSTPVRVCAHAPTTPVTVTVQTERRVPAPLPPPAPPNPHPPPHASKGWSWDAMPSGYVPEPLGGGDASVNSMLADPAFQSLQRGGPAGMMAPLVKDLFGRWGAVFEPYASAAGFPLLGDAAPTFGSSMVPFGGGGPLALGGGSSALLPSAEQLARTLPRIGVEGIRCDVSEKEHEYIVHAEVPGVPKNQLRVEVDKDNRVLRIDASTSRSKERDRTRGGVRYHLTERSGEPCVEKDALHDLQCGVTLPPLTTS